MLRSNATTHMADMDHDTDEGATRGARIDELLARHLPGLRGFLRRRAPELVLERESTEDLAQSVCRDVLEHLEDGRLEVSEESAFKQWLYEAALWKLRARARRHRTQRRDIAREVERLDRSDTRGDAHAPAVSETPSRIAQTAERREAVRTAIAALGGRDAEVLRLAVLEERPHREIAANLGVDESHSRVLLSRALARLARTLGSEL